jgi:hypothetical protein
MSKILQNSSFAAGKNGFIFSFLFVCFTGTLFSQNTSNKADSIIVEALKYRDLYGEYIREYNARVYIKGDMEVKKKNWLFQYAPDFFFWNRKGNNTFAETIMDVHYTAPNYFTHEIKALNGNKLSAEDIRKRVLQFLNINIYNPTIINDRILLPNIRNVFKYYRFEYVASMDTLENRIHQIKIIPKVKSQNLISGFFYIVDGAWTVYRFDIAGEWEFSKFRVETEYGLQQKNFLLPLNSSITFHINVLGNETENHYFSHYEYYSVSLYDGPENESPVDYDLSNYFDIHTDSLPVVRDSLFWQANRPVPLSPQEASLVQNGFIARKASDSISLNKQEIWYDSPGLIIPKKFKYNNTQFSYSGLLNPFKFAYSQLDGILYWQQLKLQKQFDSGKEIQFNPDLGILFQKKEFYFNTPVQWLFAPRKFGNVSFTFGNRNQSYNSTIIDKINAEMPNLIDFKDLNLNYFQHFHTGLESACELVNGLLFHGGIYYDWYILPKVEWYRTFVPVVGLRWTPGQYYRINGKRKEYLDSCFPTFSAEYACGIKNVFQSNSNYDRIEVDVQQTIPLGLMRSLHYYAGAGGFPNTESVYFADFENFQRRNIPQSWNDPIGGVFHLLPGEWYNASNLYCQVHFMYESPFVILHLFRGIAKDIVKERIYVSQLYTPVLPCYTEVGYGVGNFFGNAGVFVSFNRGRYESIGTKFSFELAW